MNKRLYDLGYSHAVRGMAAQSDDPDYLRGFWDAREGTVLEVSDGQIAEDAELAADAADLETSSDVQGDRIAMFRREY